MLSTYVFFFPNHTWFHYLNDTTFEYDKQSLHKTRRAWHKYIDKIRGTYNHVVLIGYSQGACTAVDIALTYTKHAIPVFSISGFVMSSQMVKNGETYHENGMLIYTAHGKYDSIIPLSFAKKSYRLLYNKSSNRNSQTQTSAIITKKKHVELRYDHWEFWEDAIFRRALFQFLNDSSVELRSSVC